MWNHHHSYLDISSSHSTTYQFICTSWVHRWLLSDLKCYVLIFQNAPFNSVIILHAVAHNPTGVDLTKDQWKEICRICKVCKDEHFCLNHLLFNLYSHIFIILWCIKIFSKQYTVINIISKSLFIELVQWVTNPVI